MLDRTFLCTDIEGSTTLWERFPERMRSALARHDSILREVIGQHSGSVFKTVGDSFCAVITSVSAAVTASADAQRVLMEGSLGWNRRAYSSPHGNPHGP